MAKCYLCRGPLEKGGRGDFALTIDHVHPLARGGKDNRENKRKACAKCNTTKGDMMIWEFWHMMDYRELHPEYVAYLEEKGRNPIEQGAIHMMVSMFRQRVWKWKEYWKNGNRRSDGQGVADQRRQDLSKGGGGGET